MLSTLRSFGIFFFFFLIQYLNIRRLRTDSAIRWINRAQQHVAMRNCRRGGNSATIIDHLSLYFVILFFRFLFSFFWVFVSFWSSKRIKKKRSNKNLFYSVILDSVCCSFNSLRALRERAAHAAHNTRS